MGKDQDEARPSTKQPEAFMSPEMTGSAPISKVQLLWEGFDSCQEPVSNIEKQ